MIIELKKSPAELAYQLGGVKYITNETEYGDGHFAVTIFDRRVFCATVFEYVKDADTDEVFVRDGEWVYDGVGKVSPECAFPLPEDVKRMKHCLGMDHKKPYKRHGRVFYRPYRNYFCTLDTDTDWERLMLLGMAERGEWNARCGGFTYCLTPKGIEWLAEELNIHIYPEEE